jgi:hypothetical protein
MQNALVLEIILISLATKRIQPNHIDNKYESFFFFFEKLDVEEFNMI